MKKLSIIFALLLFCVTLHSQQSKDYYYYQGKKVFLTEKSDKIFINLWKNADTESLFSLMQADKYLKLNGLNKNTLNTYLILEVKEGKFSSETLDQYRNNPAVKSAQFMLEYEHNILIGLLNEFTVKLKSATSFAQLQNLISKYVGCVIEREERFVKNQYVLSVNRLSEFNALQLANLFYETGLFEFSKPNFAVINTLCSNDPYFEDQWALLNSSFGGVDIKAEQAWNITQGSPLITIAVPDNGVDLYQPDLQSNLLSGYDVTDSNSDGAPVTDQDNHGTACAGIIGAIKDNDEGISGVAPGCRLIPIKMSCTYELYGNIFTVIKAEWAAYAIRLAYNVGADVISNSWGGGPPDDDVTNAINDAVAYGRNNRGCVIVFASGNKDPYSVNNDIVSYPACLPNVISVGASSPNGFRPLFSNYGIDLDVVAPGEYIYTTDRTGNAGYVGSSKTAEMNICFRDSVRSNITSRDLPDGSDYYCCFTGTSAACPHVAGIAALILSTNNSFSWLQVKEIIESSAQKVKEYNYIYSPIIGRPNGTWNNEMGYGLVDAHKAVVYAKVYGQPKSISGDSNLSICNTYSYTCNIAHQEIFTYQWSCSSNLLITTDVSSNTISITPVNENSGYVSVDIFNQGRLMFTLTKSVFVNNTALPPLTPIVGTSISTNTTWANNNYFLASSVAVERGATLTITSNVYCTSNVSITVQPGGKLVIDGGILQNACEEEMWQGITVLGDRRYTGLVQMKNGGTIQNAITGILVKDEGYVSTNNANFINNTTGVLFQNQDLSNSFTSTNFELNSSYFGATPFVAHIKAQNGGSITATVCTFSGTGSGYGIWASNTNLVVKEYCSDPSPSVGIICPENYVEPSAFSGLNYGIYHISGGILPTLKVRFSHFSNCMENIYIAGTNFAEVIKNDFDITRNMGRGMLVRYATGYKIEENTFRDSNHNPKKTTTGMLVQGSGSAENEVYKNEYKNLSIGQQFSEKNSSQTDIVPCPNCPQSKGIPPPPVTGVQTLCNQFENNYAKDIFISQSASIRKNQGSDTSPAGNRFLGSTPFNIDNALSQHSIEYYYGSFRSELPNMVSPNVTLIRATLDNSCPSKIGSIIINPQNKGEGGLEQSLISHISHLISLHLIRLRLCRTPPKES